MLLIPQLTATATSTVTIYSSSNIGVPTTSAVTTYSLAIPAVLTKPIKLHKLEPIRKHKHKLGTDQIEKLLEKLGNDSIVVFAPIIEEVGTIQWNVIDSGDDTGKSKSPQSREGHRHACKQHTITPTVTRHATSSWCNPFVMGGPSTTVVTSASYTHRDRPLTSGPETGERVS